MSWGYPYNKRLIINARIETVLGKPLFQRSMFDKKCLFACTGFFEWAAHNGKKQKFMIKPAGEDFFYLAGLYNSFFGSAEKKNHFVIITAPANEHMKELHDRMPLIVPKLRADA